MDKQYDKRIRRTPRKSESGNTDRFTQNNFKNIKLENAWPGGNVCILVQEIQLQSRLGAHVPEWITK